VGTGKLLSEFELESSDRLISFNPDWRILATVDWEEGWVWMWDVNTGISLAVLKVNVANAEVVFSPDGSFLATGGNTVRLWGVPAGQ
jgi:WD40 repeat protein